MGKMKNVAIAVLLAVLMLTSACMTSNAPELMEFLTPANEVLDLGGMVLTFETDWMNQFYPHRGDATAWGEKQRDRYDEVGKKYNCVIEYKDLSDYGYSPTELLTKLLVAGKPTPNLIDMHSSEVYNYYKAGILCALDDISTIDINDEKWGPKAFRTYGIFNEKSYGFFPYEWENMPEYAGGLIYNIELANSDGFSYNVHELKESGQWTWETFEDILNSMLGVDESVSPLSIRTGEGLDYFCKAAIFSNNGEVVAQQADGTYAFALGDPEAVEALEWVQKLMNSGVIENDVDTVSFTKNASYFHACESYVATHTDDWMAGQYPNSVMNDFTFINMPTGPKADENTVSAYTHASRRLFWVPEGGNLEVDILGTIIDEIFEPLEDSPSQAWREMSQNFMYLYTEGYEEFSFGVDNCNYDYTAQLFNVRDDINEALVNIANGASITAELDAIRNVVDSAIDSELNQQ